MVREVVRLGSATGRFAARARPDDIRLSHPGIFRVFKVRQDGLKARKDVRAGVGQGPGAGVAIEQHGRFGWQRRCGNGRRSL
jgi:hypothetical protein